MSVYSKNCYFSFNCGGEKSTYSGSTDISKELFRRLHRQDSEFCYENDQLRKKYRSVYLDDSKNINSAFLYDCSNCQDCFMSQGFVTGNMCSGMGNVQKRIHKNGCKEMNGSY